MRTSFAAYFSGRPGLPELIVVFACIITSLLKTGSPMPLSGEYSSAEICGQNNVIHLQQSSVISLLLLFGNIFKKIGVRMI